MIEKLVIKNFKNILNQTLEFSDNVNLIVGRNGQGKTSLFEAIHTLIYIKSFNELRDRNLLNFESKDDYYYLRGTSENLDFPTDLSIYYDKKEQKKIIKRNDEKITKFSGYFGDIDAVVFVQNDIDIIDDAEYRKKYFNRVISALSPHFIDLYHRYATLLKEKSALLKKDGYFNESDRRLYKIYNTQLAKLSFELAQYKMAAYELILKNLEKSKLLYSSFTNFDIKYKTPTTVDEWIEKFNTITEREIQSRRISEGVHREHFDIYYEGKQVNKFYSEGQKKMFSVLLKHSEYNLLEENKKNTPILIFDDVYSKLDRKNIDLVEEMINSVNGQVFVSFIEDYSAQHYKYNKKFTVTNGEFHDS